ncbi:hypothetical protein Glove_648g2 [Diversispora epigaea]|uniref:WAP domain-containing protein n=1 Tax=Diversispora epigaea TaxID=1348612 RepID=A0A397G448_9GLOM|nr:hypothetical protein Glove_648g2 [Diversispora epigaea]
MLNKTLFFKTASLIALMLLFLFSVSANNINKTKTITITRDNTKTIYPSNCPGRLTTTTSTSITVTKTTKFVCITTTEFTTATSTTTSITTTTTITTIPLLAIHYKKRSDTIICNLETACYFKNRFTKVVFCKPTVYLSCPKVCTKTSKTTLTSTSIITSTSISTITSAFTTTSTSLSTSTFTVTMPACIDPGLECDISYPEQCCSGFCVTANNINKSKTITVTRDHTETIYPSNCPGRLTTTTSTSIKVTKTTKFNSFTKVVFCKPTVYLPCPKIYTKTAKTTSTSTSIITSISISTITSAFTTTSTSLSTSTFTVTTMPACIDPGLECDISYPEQCCSGFCGSNYNVTYCL